MDLGHEVLPGDAGALWTPSRCPRCIWNRSIFQCKKHIGVVSQVLKDLGCEGLSCFLSIKDTCMQMIHASNYADDPYLNTSCYAWVCLFFPAWMSRTRHGWFGKEPQFSSESPAESGMIGVWIIPDPWASFISQNATAYPLILDVYLSIGFWRILCPKIVETITCCFVDVYSLFDSAGFLLHDKAPNAFSFGATVNAFEKDNAQWWGREVRIDSGIEITIVLRILYQITCCDI